MTASEGYAQSTTGAAVDYAYSSVTQRLTSISTDSTTYRFTYDTFGNTTGISANNSTLASYSYNSNNGKLNTLTYGNGLEVRYIYDSLDRVSQICYNIDDSGFETVYSYEYDSSGRLYAVTDHRENIVTVYKYDAEGRLIGFTEYDSESYTNTFEQTILYDEESRVSMVCNSVDYRYGTSYAVDDIEYSYFYNNQTGNLYKMHISGDGASGWVYINYDSFGRLSSKNLEMYAKGSLAYRNNVTYTYLKNGSYQTGLVSELYSRVLSGDDEYASYSSYYAYTYDANGNITQIDHDYGIDKYYYDDLGQLIREDNDRLNETYVYTYDDAGNRLTKTVYPYTTAATLSGTAYSDNYEYIGDRLASFYSDDSILYFVEYDSIGNPVHFSEDCFPMYGYVMEWDGRQLMGISDLMLDENDEIVETQIIAYTYNADGIRTSKTVGGIKHEYLLNGSQIIAERWGNSGAMLVYLYDESGSPIGMKYRTAYYAEGVYDSYFFEKNLQGDIVAIYDGNGNQIGQYTYDAWGKVTVSYGSNNNVVTNLNPFRYRGYYYDVETGFYYLQSRYYNPSWGRFLNADGYINANGDILGYNMYAYCGNNPVMGYDPTGTFTWDSLREFGKNCIDVAFAAVCITGAALSIGAAVTGTIMSGGAGAVAIPAAVALAAECLVVAAGTVATVGVVSCVAADVGSSVSNIIGENGQKTPSTTTWKGQGGTERLDVENPSPGNRSGQIHYHDPQNGSHMFDFVTKQFQNPTSRLKKLLSDKNFLRGLEKAYKILGETW